jgi:hypothetical protein
VLKLLPLILVPLAALLSINCGIIALPFEGPKVIARNAKTIEFTVDILDPDQNPLDDVTVTTTRYAYRVDPVFSTLGEEKTDPARTVDQSFSFKCTGKYAVAVEFAKRGYLTQKILYALEDEQSVPPSGFYISRPDQDFHDRINVTTRRHSKLTLTPGEGRAPLPKSRFDRSP